MRNIFSLCAICMVVFLSIIGCEEKKACGYKVKEDYNDPGLVLLREEKAKGFYEKSPSERIKILNKAIPKATTLDARVTLLEMRVKAKTENNDTPGALKDTSEAVKLGECLADNAFTFG